MAAAVERLPGGRAKRVPGGGFASVVATPCGGRMSAGGGRKDGILACRDAKDVTAESMWGCMVDGISVTSVCVNNWACDLAIGHRQAACLVPDTPGAAAIADAAVACSCLRCMAEN